jgi:O-antigen ligase
LFTSTTDSARPGAADRGELADRILAALLAIAIAVPAFMTGDYSMKPLFYTLVIVPTLAFVVTGRIALAQFRPYIRAILLLLVSLLFWSASNLWSGDPDLFLAFLRRSLTLLVFVLGAIHVVGAARRAFLDYLDIALCLVGVGAAIIVVGLPFTEAPSESWRPGDGTVFNRALHASHYFGFFATCAFVRFYQLSGSRALVCLISGGLCLLFVFATESRGTLVALGLVGLVISLYWHRRYAHALALLLLCGIGFVAMHEILLERGLSYRQEIWAGAMDLAREHFWLGVGMGTDLGIPYGDDFTAPHAHNQLLDLLVKSGLFGLLLFLPWVGFILWRVIAGRCEEQVFSAALLFFLLCGMSDVHKLINSPTTVYIVFWLPLAGLLVTHGAARQHPEPVADSAGEPVGARH